MDPNKAKIIAHLQADGGFYLRGAKGNVVRYFNNDMTLIGDFRKAIYKVYDIKAWKPSKGRTCWETGSGTTPVLSDLSKYSLGTKNWKIPKSIIEGKDGVKAVYLRAFFDDEASVVLRKKSRGWDREVKVFSVNYNGLKQIVRLLKNFGISASIYGPYRGKYFELRIMKKADLITYFRKIGFNSCPKKKMLLTIVKSCR